MQDCFRKYPDIYGSELADDDDEEAPSQAQEGADAALTKSAETQQPAGSPEPSESPSKEAPAAEAEKEQQGGSIPKKATDATSADNAKEQ